MKFRFLNNTLENQRYQYNPRYYDPRKERLVKKKEQYQKLEMKMFQMKNVGNISKKK